MRCMITANRRANATTAFCKPRFACLRRSFSKALSPKQRIYERYPQCSNTHSVPQLCGRIAFYVFLYAMIPQGKEI